MKNSNKIGVVDIGIGNIGSIINMHRYLGIKIEKITSPEKLKNFTHLILPGVGSFDYAIEQLKIKGLYEPIIQFGKKKENKILGICLGMQLLLDGSEEGNSKGLGLIRGKVIRFKTKKVPHMGWNFVKNSSPNPFFFENNSYKFYFVHSYYMAEVNQTTIGKTVFENEEFSAAISNGTNIYGMQFHPEKSHDFGLAVFEKFSKL